MPESPESDSTTQPLAGLDIDLALSFVPAWAKEDAVRDRHSRLAAHEGEGDRFSERPRGRREGGPGRGPREGGPRRRPSGSPGAPGGARSQDGGRPRRGGPDRGPRSPRRDDGGERRAPAPPALLGWSVEIQADPRGVEGMAQQLKSGSKAYPLFNLAGLVLEKPERFRASFKRVAEQPESLFQVKLDGSLWLSERDAVAHVLARHRDRYYRTETLEGEPPKGSFSFIAVCGMSGTVLGPPNFHDYTPRLLRLHAERFAHLPFEVFKGRIKMVKDEALLEKWKKEQSVQEVYFPLERPPRRAAGPAAPESAVSQEPGAPEAAGSQAAAVPETVEAAPAAPAEPDAAEVSDAAPAPELPADAPAASAAEAGPGPEPAPGLKLASRAELEAHFREHHAARIISAVRDKAALPAPVALQSSSAPVASRVRQLWEELRRFPLPLAQRLGQQFTSRGLHLFKAHGRVTYVTPARPRFLDLENTPVDDAVRGILEYLHAYPKVPRAGQWLGLVALRTALPEAERESALAKDLLWLIREGHVIDFAGGRLEAARKPKPAPTPALAQKSAAAPVDAGEDASAAPVEASAEAPVEEEQGLETQELSVEDDAVSELPEADGSLPGDPDAPEEAAR